MTEQPNEGPCSNLDGVIEIFKTLLNLSLENKMMKLSQFMCSVVFYAFPDGQVM